MTNQYETLNSQVERLSRENVNLKERNRGSAARPWLLLLEVEGVQAYVMPNTFTPTRVEQEGTVDKARTLVSGIKAITSEADLNKLNWELTDRDQGNFVFMMMALLWFNEDLNFQERKRVQLDIQQALVWPPVRIHGDIVRATLEIFPERIPWNKVQAVFFCAVREIAGLPRETFDIRWVPTLGQQCTLWWFARFDTVGVHHDRGNLSTEP